MHFYWYLSFLSEILASRQSEFCTDFLGLIIVKTLRIKEIIYSFTEEVLQFLDQIIHLYYNYRPLLLSVSVISSRHNIAFNILFIACWIYSHYNQLNIKVLASLSDWNSAVIFIFKGSYIYYVCTFWWGNNAFWAQNCGSAPL